MPDLTVFRKALYNYLSVDPTDINCYVRAFTYVISENRENYPTFQVLEPVGDAVIGYLTTLYLVEKYANMSEKYIVREKSFLISSGSLGKEAIRLNMNKLLLVARGIIKTNAGNRFYADVFESFIGALHYDKGLVECRAFLERELFYKSINPKDRPIDPKSGLQQIVLEKFGANPTYKEMRASSNGRGLPPNTSGFIFCVYANNMLLGTGIGDDKKQAQQNAARNALSSIEF